MRKVGKVQIPNGKKVAVNIGCDFDAQAIWLGANLSSPAYMSRGEFGAEVGAPRLLDLFNQYKIKTTWCIPGHTIDTFTDICEEVVKNGHEVAHHGYAHENVTCLSLEKEDKIMQMGLEALSKIGVIPKGYRSPSWDFSMNTLDILEKYNFAYDSSLMGHDLFPYIPRHIEVNTDKENIFTKNSKIVELPVSWCLDDFPCLEFIDGEQEGLRPTKDILHRWQSIYDYAHEKLTGACFILTVHPQTIGRAHTLKMLDQFIHYLSSKDAWFATLDDIYKATEFKV